MEDNLLSLKWNYHKSTFYHILSSLRQKGTFSDATLACEGRFFPVHKLVMSTCSDYFSDVFERTNCKSPIVILKDIQHDALEALLDFMYLGEVNVKENVLPSIIKAAECLRIKGLAIPDEDPTLPLKNTSHLLDRRSSPTPKRLRREINSGSYLSSHHHANKKRKSLVSSSSILTSTPDRSQSVNSGFLAHVPSSPTHSDSVNADPLSKYFQKYAVQCIVPLEMIKVEIKDEGNDSTSPLRTQECSPDPHGEREGVRFACGENSIEEGHRDKEIFSNTFEEHSGHSDEIQKDPLDTFNGSDQMTGPSGTQGLSNDCERSLMPLEMCSLKGARETFYEQLKKLADSNNDRSFFLDTERYKKILGEVKEAQELRKNSLPLTSKHYRRMKRYDVLRIGDTEKLIESGSSEKDSKRRYYCSGEELFDVLESAHIKTGHKKTRIMEVELKKTYANITRKAIDVYLPLCDQCQLKKAKRGLVVHPVLSNDMNSLCQMDMSGTQSEPK